MESFEASHCGAPLVISFRFGHVSPYLCRHHAAGAAAAAAPAAAALVAVDMLSASLVNGVAKGTETQKDSCFTDSKHPIQRSSPAKKAQVKTLASLKSCIIFDFPFTLLQRKLDLEGHMFVRNGQRQSSNQNESHASFDNHT